MAKIHVVRQAYEADVVALEVIDAREADILAFVESGGARAIGDTHWFYAGKFQATTKLFWGGHQDAIALKVFFVKEAAQAGWTKDHALRGHL